MTVEDTEGVGVTGVAPPPFKMQKQRGKREKIKDKKRCEKVR